MRVKTRQEVDAGICGRPWLVPRTLTAAHVMSPAAAMSSTQTWRSGIASRSRAIRSRRASAPPCCRHGEWSAKSAVSTSSRMESRPLLKPSSMSLRKTRLWSFTDIDPLSAPSYCCPVRSQVGRRALRRPRYQNRPWLGDHRRSCPPHRGPPVAFLCPQELHDAAREVRRIARVRTPPIFRRRVHAGDEVELDDIASHLVHRFSVHDVRGHQEDRGAKGRGRQVHEPEEVPEEGVLDQPLLLDKESFLQPATAAVWVEDARGLHLQGEAQAEVLLEVSFEVPPIIVRHRHHHLQRPAWPAEGEQLGDLGLGEAAELDVA